MKNKQAGFIIPLIIAIVAILIAGGAYFAFEKGKQVQVVQGGGQFVASTTVYDNVYTNATQAGSTATSSILPIPTSKPPVGYMIPNMAEIPAGYSLSSGGGFTDHSASYNFRGQSSYQNLSFIETMASYFSRSLGIVMSFPGATAIKGFTYKNNQGAVVGDFETNLYEGSPSSPTQSEPYDEYYLLYDHNGRLVEIHTYDVSTLTPDKLIQLLEEMKISQ